MEQLGIYEQLINNLVSQNLSKLNKNAFFIKESKRKRLNF